MQPTILIPLGTAIAFALGALCLKRSTNDGIGPWRTTFVSNLIVGAMAFPFWFLGKPIESLGQLAMPLVVSVSFFLGQLLSCLAIHKGDVSVVTPLMGTKAIMVAVAATLIIGDPLGLAVWVGAAMSTIAVLLMRGEGRAERARLLPSILLGLACALFFSLSDVLMQFFGSSIGFEKLVAVTFSFVAIWSFGLIPLFRSPVTKITRTAWTWLAAGGTILAIQAIGMGYVLAVHGDAATVNIVYSSRGFWSVALVWLVGHWFSNQERALGRAEMIRRMLGSVLMLGAIVVVMLA